MTAMINPLLAETGPHSIALGWLGQPSLLAGLDRGDLLSFDDHLAQHGNVPAVPTSNSLLRSLDAVRLTGRGGAAFPLAAKIRALRADQPPVIVVNGCEGEPGSAKDTVLLGRAPHVVLDGAALVAATIGARRVVVAITNVALERALFAATSTRPDARLFEVRRLPERFGSGEARALVAGLNGGPAVPPGRRILPTDRGVDGAPTLLSNAETFAQVASLLRHGVGGSDRTVLLTVTGAVRRPAVLEVPLGIELGAVAQAVGAEACQAVVIGGYHGSWVSPDPRIVLSDAGLAAAGGTFGAGAVMFVGQQTCGLAELARVAEWLAAQSTKSCGPCAFGLPALAADIRSIAMGSAPPNVALRHAGLVTGRGACAHPGGAARFVTTGLRLLQADIRAHQGRAGCDRPDLANLPMSRAQAFRGAL